MVEKLGGLGVGTYGVWRSGELWLLSCLEIHCDKVNCTFGGGGKV
jgi:hypothetical protein